MGEIDEMKIIIEQMRSRLHDTVKDKCLTDPEIIKISQELNDMLNKYERLLNRKCGDK